MFFPKQVTYAEPELVTGVGINSRYMGLGTSSSGGGGMPSPFAPVPPAPSGGSTGGGGHYSSSLLNSSVAAAAALNQPNSTASKFNTIHSR